MIINYYIAYRSTTLKNICAMVQKQNKKQLPYALHKIIANYVGIITLLTVHME